MDNLAAEFNRVMRERQQSDRAFILSLSEEELRKHAIEQQQHMSQLQRELAVLKVQNCQLKEDAGRLERVFHELTKRYTALKVMLDEAREIVRNSTKQNCGDK